MEYDRFCPVTGWASMEREDEFLNYISTNPFDSFSWDSEAEAGHRLPSPVVQQGLRYTTEDIEAMNKYVLVTPCEVNGDGELFVPEIFTEPEVLDENAFTYVFDVHPSPRERRSGVYCKGPPSRGSNNSSGVVRRYAGVGSKGRVVIHFCAFLILQHLIPGLKPHVIYSLVTEFGRGKYGALQNVEYGSVEDTQEHEVAWMMIGDFDSFGFVESEDRNPDYSFEDWWLDLLTQEGKSDDETLKDAWMGDGNMWVFKHPGIFPIAEAVRLAKECPPQILFTTASPRVNHAGQSEVFDHTPLLRLPFELMDIVFGNLSPRDVLRLASASRTLYRRFRTHLDKFTYGFIQRYNPWYLPVGPIPCEEGDTEIVRWKSDWDKLGISSRGGSGNETGIPWFAYYLVCEKSPNVRSRERIWDIVLDIKDILVSTSSLGYTV